MQYDYGCCFSKHLSEWKYKCLRYAKYSSVFGLNTDLGPAWFSLDRRQTPAFVDRRTETEAWQFHMFSAAPRFFIEPGENAGLHLMVILGNWAD